MIKATIILVIGLYSQCALSGSLVNVRLPFLSPAGVTYINGPTPTGLVAGPVAIPARYAQPQFGGPNQYVGPAQYAAPLQYSAQAQYPVPSQYAAPASYAAQQSFGAPLFAAPLLRSAPVPHIPAVADIPVTQYEAHHGFVQKLVDVAKPALKTRKYEVRRPAIQKHFYDIEERIIVRPAGSALVELDQPTSKNQRGADIITPVLPAVAVPARLALPHQTVFVSSTPSPFIYSTVSGVSSTSPIQFAPQQQLNPQQVQQPQQPQPEQQSQNTFNPSDNEDNNDSVVVEARSNFGQINPQQPQRQEQPQPNSQLETEVRFRSLGSPPPAPRFNLAQSSDEQQDQQQQQQEQENARSNEQRNFNSPQFLPQREQNQQQQQQQQQNEPQSRNAPQFFQPEQNNDQNQQQQQREPEQEQQQRSENQPRQLQRENFEQQELNQAGPSGNVVFRNSISEEESLSNQQRFIRLLTENDGISELDQSDGRKFSFRGDSGLLRARVLQFNQAGPNAKATDERVNTRRFVLSRPIETVQEIEVVEPITKIHQVAVNEPTIFKTARLGYQRVQTSVPTLPIHGQYTGFHH